MTITIIDMKILITRITYMKITINIIIYMKITIITIIIKYKHKTIIITINTK